MLSALSQCETAMDKSYLVHSMNIKEQENYDMLNSKIGKILIIFEYVIITPNFFFREMIQGCA